MDAETRRSDNPSERSGWVMSDRPVVTVEPATANAIWVKVIDGAEIYIGTDGIIVHAKGSMVEVRS